MRPGSRQVSRRRRLGAMAVAGFGLTAVSAPAFAQAAPFTVTSPAFADGGMLGRANAGGIFGTTNCGGGNLSPPLAWSNAPAATRTFAIVVSDPDGGEGLGSVHWVAYGIASNVTSVAAGEGSQPSPAFVGGTNGRNLQTYFGPCPPPGEMPHHYHFSVFALDIAAGELGPGLTRDALFAKIKGHILAQSSIIGRYAR